MSDKRLVENVTHALSRELILSEVVRIKDHSNEHMEDEEIIRILCGGAELVTLFPEIAAKGRKA